MINELHLSLCLTPRLLQKSRSHFNWQIIVSGCKKVKWVSEATPGSVVAYRRGLSGRRNRCAREVLVGGLAIAVRTKITWSSRDKPLHEYVASLRNRIYRCSHGRCRCPLSYCTSRLHCYEAPPNPPEILRRALRIVRYNLWLSRTARDVFNK